jgi:hypothetical protein
LFRRATAEKSNNLMSFSLANFVSSSSQLGDIARRQVIPGTIAVFRRDLHHVVDGCRWVISGPYENAADLRAASGQRFQS